MVRVKVGFPAVRVLLVSLLLAVAIQSGLVGVAWAQDYRFNLAENRASLFIGQDGVVQVVLDMTFVCDDGADPIDVVDVGMPNSTYDLGAIRASIDGIPLDELSNSPYVKPGIAVEFGEHAIQPGRSGTLHVEATVTDLVYQDSEDAEYASIEFSPTWFESGFVYGVTRLEVNFHFPPGVTAEEPRYHDQEFTTAGFEDDRAVYTWIDEEASGSSQYVFGASFPKRYLAEGVVQKPPAFTLDLGRVCAGPLPWFIAFGLGWVFLAVLGSLSQRRRKMKYLPPAVAVEGTGVRRGLTAVEAAILLEAPLNKVMTMILFGLLKKGVIAVESEKPLKVRAVEAADLPEDKLRYYERRFLNAIQPDQSLDEKELRELVVDLIGDVNKKLAGFSASDTKAYYKDIAARAWEQVEGADTPEVLGERWSDGLEWTMLDNDWDDHTRRVFRDRPVVVPNWWWGYRPWAAGTGLPSRPTAAAPTPIPSTGGTPVTLPTLPGSDFANTVVGGIENAANTVVSRIESFTGAITNKTNPPPKPSSSRSSGSRRSGGGYSCACACACAGCACACAGGGR